MTDRELMQMALDALELMNGSERADGIIVYADEEIKALRDRLARPDPEPVAWLDNGLGVFYWACEFNDRPVPPGFEPLYAAYPRHWSNVTDDALIEEVRHRGFTIRDAQISPKREWVGLTDEEIEEHFFDNVNTGCLLSFGAGAAYAEAKLKEKNS